MVNHFYTVLLNLNGEYIPQISKTEVYVPSFTAKRVPQDIKYVEHSLFGDCLTEESAREKAQVLTSLVLKSDLHDVVTEIDSRITLEDVTTFPSSQKDYSLTFSIDSLSACPENILLKMFRDNEDLESVYNLGTCVDRLVALVCAYVRYMDNL